LALAKKTKTASRSASNTGASLRVPLVQAAWRCIEVDERITVRATITVDVYGIGTDDQEIIYMDSEIDDPNHEIELGEVDVFAPEDAWHDDDQPDEWPSRRALLHKTAQSGQANIRKDRSGSRVFCR
jgi:hypothetical protein